MAREEIKGLVKESKAAVQKEFDGHVQSIRDEVADLKRTTLDKIGS